MILFIIQQKKSATENASSGLLVGKQLIKWTEFLFFSSGGDEMKVAVKWLPKQFEKFFVAKKR